MKDNTLGSYNIADLREEARRTLPKGLFDFVDRGTEDDISSRCRSRSPRRARPGCSGTRARSRRRALAVTSTNRFSLLPEVPTISESGFEFDLATWWGLHTQAAVRRNIVVKFNADTVRLLRQADVKDKIASVGAEAVGNSSDEFAAFLRSEAEKLAVFAKAAKLKID